MGLDGPANRAPARGARAFLCVFMVKVKFPAADEYLKRAVASILKDHAPDPLN